MVNVDIRRLIEMEKNESFNLDRLLEGEHAVKWDFELTQKGLARFRRKIIDQIFEENPDLACYTANHVYRIEKDNIAHCAYIGGQLCQYNLPNNLCGYDVDVKHKN